MISSKCSFGLFLLIQFVLESSVDILIYFFLINFLNCFFSKDNSVRVLELSFSLGACFPMSVKSCLRS